MKKRRVEVMIETHQIWTISQPSILAPSWCPECARTVRMMTMDEAARLAHQSARTIYGWIEAGRLHYRETPLGSLRVCLDSLFAGAGGSPRPSPRSSRAAGGGEHTAARLQAADQNVQVTEKK